MCYAYNITFPGCRSHKVTTLELCNDRLGERQRLASTPSFCCGLFSSSRPKERKVCTPEPRWILRNEPCPTCLRNSRVSSKTQTKRRNVDAYIPPPPPPPQAYQHQTPPMQQGFLNERQMQSMMKLQETYRGKAAKRSSSVYSADEYYGPRPVAAAPVKGYGRRPVPSYLKAKPLPPTPLGIKKQGAGALKQTPPRRPRRSEPPPPPPPVRYDDEPVPDDDFIDMVYSYNR